MNRRKSKATKKRAPGRPDGLHTTDTVLTVDHIDKLNRLHQTMLQNSRLIGHVINSVLEKHLTSTAHDAAFKLLDAAERLTNDNVTVLDNIEAVLTRAGAASRLRTRRRDAEKGAK
jgi:hypothetical protein